MRLAPLYQHHWLLLRLPIGLLASVLAAWLWQTFHPMPPTRLSITTGGAEGAYQAHARRYADIFAAHGVTLDVQTSAGSQQNLDRLRRTDAPSDLGLVQGGFGYLGPSTDYANNSRVQTLVNVDVEPLWLFTSLPQLDALAQLQGLRVAIGPDGSGSHRVALKLLEQARLAPTDLVLSPLTGTLAAQALARGELDAAMLIIAPQAESVQNMIRLPGVQPVSLRLSAAITERNPFLEARLLPRSAMGQGLPPRDLTVLTTSTSLLAREGLHPALKRLALVVALQSHGGSGLFHRAGEFPSLRQIDFPTAPQGRDMLTHGLNFLERQLPFWWAQLAERVLLIVLPVAGVALWLMVLIPAYVRWLLKSRVNRWYGELKFIENDLKHASVQGIDLTRFMLRLNGIEQALAAFRCPNELMPYCFTLHQHIDFVRRRLHGLRGR